MSRLDNLTSQSYDLNKRISNLNCLKFNLTEKANVKDGQRTYN